jgi:hypothetical protein
MCINAEKMAAVHLKEAVHCKKYKDIHTVISLIIGITATSALIGLVNSLNPTALKWVSAFLILVSAYCTAFNTYWRFPEREANHRTAAKRLQSFANSCRIVLGQYEDHIVEGREFKALLDFHNLQYQATVSESPSVSISDD